MKPSCRTILNYLILRGGWASVREVGDQCPTNTPTKRLSELVREGKVISRRNPHDRRYAQYKAVA